MDVIVTKLEEEAKKREKAIDKTKALLKRVNWLRAAKLTAGSALALSYPLIFSRAKMQLEVGASLRQLSYDES